MFTLDDRVRGLPANREQVVSLHQSINQPHLAIPGRRAGLAQAFITALRGQAGITVFVYLFLSEVGDCAVYISEHRNLSPEAYASDENEALGFVESMGFIMDNMNFRSLLPADQENLVKTLPVFRREPKAAPAATPAGATPNPAKGAPAGQPADGAAPSTAALARLLSSF